MLDTNSIITDLIVTGLEGGVENLVETRDALRCDLNTVKVDSTAHHEL